ncbi:MAG: thiamine pyrophosphate-requiring protein [Chloroflexi bacterium]|nr:thiamine pyrophosphate-requiring protein [Chloroflexota bacterium]MDA1004361.1 thiamine pyrophosphate-requiring protein [Chloroflexota bacterium]
MNTNEAIAQILKREGVEWIACFPSNNLIEEAAKVGIRTIMFRQERGALMAADGFSRMSNRERFGVVITQGGPGAENSMGGLAQAFADNVPILHLPGGNRLSEYGVRPNFSPAHTYQSVTKSAEVVLTADAAPAALRRAFHAMRNGRPGPAVVEIPADVANQELSTPELHYEPPKRHLTTPSAGDVRDAVTALLAARKPVIWSGMGVLLSAASAALTELAELTEIPVYCTLSGKSGFDERHPLALGAGSGATTLQARTWLQESDVLLALGSSLTRTGYGQPIPDGKTIIHNTESIEDINKDYTTAIGLPGDARATIEMLIEEVKAQIGPKGRKGKTTVAAEIAELKQRWMADWTDVLNSDERPINTYRVIGELERVLDHDQSVVTHDAGAPRDTIVPFYTATVPHSYIGWGKTTHLGFGIPLMIGAKLAAPDRFCLNFMGDGAFGMSGLDIETAVRAGAPITTVVLNNGGMATYPGGYPTARERFGTTHMSGNYAEIAQGLGAVGIVVTEPGEVANAIKQARRHNAEGRAVLLDVHSNLEPRRSTFR